MSEQEQEEIRKLKKKIKKQEKKNSEIRDLTAIQRTIFANERTLMAYLRTAIALIAGGFAAIKFSERTYMQLLGLFLMALGLLLAIYSFARYLVKQKNIKSQRKCNSHTSQHYDTVHEKETSNYGNID
ncbi:DUF202 domain-containing protein [Pontibacter sp. JH31]|uniref:DUF202 domain-containing protein n=1 Tax=Pontibacter aquaedesilientis TaxID=2766980 RepID=A0ABR7XKS7_9BACT|nr:DUF202 domain-containing protein [Pontibacter aquaedesilientis]MBD1398897.1 DUF202 domain-containing protein [Pontibacter aquaedesilientis]